MNTFEALAVTVIAVLPGALYTFAAEREMGITRAGLADRALRVAAVSAVFHFVLAPLTVWLYQDAWADGRLTRSPVPWMLWWAPLPYLVLPLLAGSVVGAGIRRNRRWALVVHGQTREPQAWDALFGHQPSLWLRLRLKDTAAGCNGWVLGAFARDPRGLLDSRASGYPEPQDLYLCDTAMCNGDGLFVLGTDQRPQLRNIGILISREEISFMEVIWSEPGP
ncbi:DUF6338 family protein [Streptomyces sp. NPDC007905]|uniref:DUF6338 family protein n=1 Tax=Streptomyces sp. NPDC007905 TaxID=3364788 RepID=UPI0036E5D9B7